MFTNLCNLKELHLDRMHPGGPPLLVSSAAELTKLEIEGCVVSHSMYVYQAYLQALAFVCPFKQDHSFEIGP